MYKFTIITDLRDCSYSLIEQTSFRTNKNLNNMSSKFNSTSINIYIYSHYTPELQITDFFQAHLGHFENWPYSVCSVMSNSLQPLGKLLCLWNYPSENTGIGCHFLFQGIFPTQGWSPHLLGLLQWPVDSLPPLSHLGSPTVYCHKANLNKFQSSEVIQSMFLDLQLKYRSVTKR